MQMTRAAHAGRKAADAHEDPFRADRIGGDRPESRHRPGRLALRDLIAFDDGDLPKVPFGHGAILRPLMLGDDRIR